MFNVREMTSQSYLKLNHLYPVFPLLNGIKGCKGRLDKKKCFLYMRP